MEAALLKERHKGILLVLVAGFCWGFHGVLIKFAYQLGVSFMEVFLAEAFVASIIYSFLLFRSKGIRYPKVFSEWAWLSLAGVASVGVGSFLFLSFSLGPIAIGATLLFLYLPQVFIFSVIASKQRPSWLSISSILLLLVGAIVTTDALNAFNGETSIAPILAGTIASVCYATIFVLTPRLSKSSSATFLSLFLALFNFVGSLIVLAVLPVTRGDTSSGLLELSIYAIVLGIFGQTLPILAMMKGIPLAGSSLSGVLAATELPVAVVSSAIFLKEAITPERAVGVTLVFAGIVLFNHNNNS